MSDEEVSGNLMMMLYKFFFRMDNSRTCQRRFDVVCDRLEHEVRAFKVLVLYPTV